MKTKAILIDATTKRVSLVEISGDLNEYYRLIGCDTFTTVNIGNGDAIFVDDEGLLKGEVTEAFTFKDQLLCGNGLIVGSDAEGEAKDAKISLEDVKKLVKFPPDGWKLNADTHDKLLKWTVTTF